MQAVRVSVPTTVLLQILSLDGLIVFASHGHSFIGVLVGSLETRFVESLMSTVPRQLFDCLGISRSSLVSSIFQLYNAQGT